MKKIFCCIGLMLLLVACSKKEKNSPKANETANNIVSANVSYSTTVREYFYIVLDFSKNEMFLRDYNNDEENMFIIKNTKRVKKFLLTYIEMDYNDNYEARIYKNNDDQKNIWSLNISTKDKRYSYSSVKEYPDNWNEFLNMLNEETGANLKIIQK